MHKTTLNLLFLLFVSSISHSQYRNDFMISDSARHPYFDFDKDGIVHMVWTNDQKRNKSAQYSALDSVGDFIYSARRISSTIFAANLRLSINDSLVACIWEDRVSLDFTIFSTYIKGRILKDGLDYSDELQIDDGDLVMNDAIRVQPEIIWHNDNILFAVWFGDGSRSPTEYSDIYMHKIKFPPLQKSQPLDEVLNNPFKTITEADPTIIRKKLTSGYLVVWEEIDSLNSLKIAGVACDDSLKPVSSKIVFVDLGIEDYLMGKPAVINLSNGNILIAWSKDLATYSNTNIYMQEFTEEGVTIGEIIKVNDAYASAGNTVNVDEDNSGNIIVAWENWPNLYGQRYSSIMNRMGENFKINTSGSDGDDIPCVRLRNGKIYTSWQRLNHGKSSVWMNIIDFSNPINTIDKTKNYPEKYHLWQNYPNPFNPTTTIKYWIPEGGLVRLKIYDILGKEVKTLVNERKATGRYEVKFDATDLATGVYFYKLKVNDFVSVKKMLLVK